MIDRQQLGGFVVYCDECSDETHETDAEEWGDMLAEIRAEGWRVYKDDAGDWTHACPSCVEDWMEAQRDG